METTKRKTFWLGRPLTKLAQRIVRLGFLINRVGHNLMWEERNSK